MLKKLTSRAFANGSSAITGDCPSEFLSTSFKACKATAQLLVNSVQYTNVIMPDSANYTTVFYISRYITDKHKRLLWHLAPNNPERPTLTKE